jgi:hypothetical protein
MVYALVDFRVRVGRAALTERGGGGGGGGGELVTGGMC